MFPDGWSMKGHDFTAVRLASPEFDRRSGQAGEGAIPKLLFSEDTASSIDMDPG